MKNVLPESCPSCSSAWRWLPLSGGALAQGSGALGVRDDSNPAYWSDRWRGWHFYEDPPQEEVEPPSRPAPSTKRLDQQRVPRPPELVEFERLQKTLEDLRNIAIMRPKRSERAPLHGVGDAGRTVPPTSPTSRSGGGMGDTRSRSLAAGLPRQRTGVGGLRATAAHRPLRLRSQPGRDHVLFFYRSDRPYCHAFGPTLQAFEARHTVSRVVAVSVDGGPLPGLPRARPDNGIATALQVTQVPAVFLAQPSSGKIMPIGSGVLSESQLLERISIVSSPQGEAMLPAPRGICTAIEIAMSSPSRVPPPVHPPTPAIALPSPGDAEHRQLPSRADLNSEVNDMFNKPGSHRELHRPRGISGQTYNTYTGGNLMMRSPNWVYQLAAVQFPSARAGCGGIDVFGAASATSRPRSSRTCPEHHSGPTRHRVPARAEAVSRCSAAA